jgi:hypothetical protein
MKTQNLNAIETLYNGYRFRSRLEARWAVFFDAVKERYEYEPEGFDLGEGDWYLPDFYLPRLNLWVEIKPGEAPAKNLRRLSKVHEKTVRFASKLARQNECGVAVLYGTPGANLSFWDGNEWKFPKSSHLYQMITFWGYVPNDDNDWDDPYLAYYISTITEFLRNKRQVLAPDYDGTWDRLMELIRIDCDVFRSIYGRDHHSLNADYGLFAETSWGGTGDEESLEIWPAYDDPDCVWEKELNAARQARFEHGVNNLNLAEYK